MAVGQAACPESPYPEIATRLATEEDLEVITTIAVQGWRHDKQWNYRFPYVEDYPEDNQRWTKFRYSQYMEMAEAGNATMMVAEKKQTSNCNKPKVIAFSIWQMPGSHVAPGPPYGGKSALSEKYKPRESRKDANPTRMKAFRKCLNKEKTTHFDNVHGENQLYLMNLVTHPDHFNQGAGKTLVRWGIEKAKREKLAVTLFASQLGFYLYRRLGFKVVGEVTVQAEGEKEKLLIPAMAFIP